MIHQIKDLIGYYARTPDGQIGQIQDFYFDDSSWKIRYAVLNYDWDSGSRSILLSPSSFQNVDVDNRTISVKIDRQTLLDSPEIDTNQPISREHEIKLHEYYDWPFYWNETAGFGIGVGDLSSVPMVDLQTDVREQQGSQGGPSFHLRSTNTIVEYHMLSKEGEDFGSVTDLLIDSNDWQIHYLLVKTAGWLNNRILVLSPAWVERVSWAQSLIYFGLDRSSLEQSPEYDPARQLNHGYENELNQHYQ